MANHRKANRGIEHKLAKYTKKIQKSHNKEDIALYKKKLAFYRKMSAMKGGVKYVKDAAGNTMEVNDDYVLQAGEEEVPADQVQVIEEEVPGSGPEQAPAEQEENVVDNTEEEEVTTGPTQIIEEEVEGPEDNTAIQVPITSNANDYEAFTNKLKDYQESLKKLISSLNAQPDKKQAVIDAMVNDLRTINENNKRKDNIIEDYIGAISETQIELSNLDKIISNIEFGDLQTQLNETGANTGQSIKNYTAMMQIHDYLLKLKTTTAVTNNDTQQAINAVNLIFNSGSDRLKDTLGTIKDNSFTPSEINADKYKNFVDTISSKSA